MLKYNKMAEQLNISRLQYMYKKLTYLILCKMNKHKILLKRNPVLKNR